jgi:AcrR family transcriptional regulator
MQNTEQNIIDAAIVVFNEDYSAPLEKVAEQAGVTRRTLHRHFKGREELLASCEKDMRRNCKQAMTQAMNSSTELLTQLEHMLYAGVDCGAKYSFLSKLHTRPEHHHTHEQAECTDYDAMMARYRAVVTHLQDQGAISKHITSEWVAMLFQGVVMATISAELNGTVAKNNLKQFAWFSFSKGIGI